MKTKYTPGPWFYDKTWGLIHDILKSAKGPHESAAEICAVHAGRTGKKDETQANARVIAASPELLEACEYAAELIKIARQYFPKSMKNNDKFQLENTCAAIGRAIQKARGEG